MGYTLLCHIGCRSVPPQRHAGRHSDQSGAWPPVPAARQALGVEHDVGETSPRAVLSFLPASAPTFSGGVRADEGYQIVHAIFQTPVPYREGFALVERHLSAIGRPRAALCAVELRCAVPYTGEQWAAPDGFNANYVALLRSWGLFIGEYNPVARTNVAPTVSAPSEQMLYAFSYTVPAPQAAATFVLSGAAEASSVRPGETAPDALREKLADVLTTLDSRLAALGVARDQVTYLYSLRRARPVSLSRIRDPAQAWSGCHPRDPLVPEPAPDRQPRDRGGSSRRGGGETVAAALIVATGQRSGRYQGRLGESSPCSWMVCKRCPLAASSMLNRSKGWGPFTATRTRSARSSATASRRELATTGPGPPLVKSTLPSGRCATGVGGCGQMHGCSHRHYSENPDGRYSTSSDGQSPGLSSPGTEPEPAYQQPAQPDRQRHEAHKADHHAKKRIHVGKWVGFRGRRWGASIETPAEGGDSQTDDCREGVESGWASASEDLSRSACRTGPGAAYRLGLVA